jgi:biopolymer transport protein ExbD
MRRFSQRNSLVTLNEINITPLLDLAFVLLIIFIIASPMLEQSIQVNLPEGGSPITEVDPQNVFTVEVTANGAYLLRGRPMALPQIRDALIQAFRANPIAVVSIRADERQPYGYVAAVIDMCKQSNLTRISFATEPPNGR